MLQRFWPPEGEVMTNWPPGWMVLPVRTVEHEIDIMRGFVFGRPGLITHFQAPEPLYPETPCTPAPPIWWVPIFGRSISPFWP